MLRPLHDVACLGIVAAFLTGCTVSDAEPQPAVGTAAAASPASPAPDTGDDESTEEQATIDLGGWSMPEPGPFDLATYQANPFEPCKEIPDEVLQRLGYRTQEITVSHLLPYPCDLVPLQRDLQGGKLFMTSEDFPVDDLPSRGVAILDDTVSGVPAAKVGQNSDSSKDRGCLVALETERGTVAIHYRNLSGIPSGETFCEAPAQIIQSMYGVNPNEA